MKNAYTQLECKAMWQAIKDKGPTFEEIDEIDSKTPYSATEPNWWCEMMDVRRQIIKEKVKRLV